MRFGPSGDTIGHFPATHRTRTGRPRLQYFPMRDFSMRVRVYIEDTDAGGVVFYANYLKYMERARTEALRAAGVDLVDWQVRHRRLFVVRSVSVEYLAPARLDDELTVHAQIHTSTRTSLACAQPIDRAGARIADARVTLACIDADRLRPVRIPAEIAAALARPSGAVPAAPPVPPTGGSSS